MDLQNDFKKATGESDMAFKRIRNTVVESCENVLGKIYIFYTVSHLNVREHIHLKLNISPTLHPKIWQPVSYLRS